MTGRVIHDLSREVREITSTGDWLSWRENILTASRIAALFDAHPYMTRDAMIAGLRGQSQGSNAAMRRGRILEPAVAAAIAEEMPYWRLRKATTFHLLSERRLGCTPDYFAETDSGLLNIQCKTVNQREWDRWAGKPPLGYLIQVACENIVTDASAGVLAVMIVSPSCPLFMFDVPRHLEAEQRILDATAAFWCAWDAGEIAAPTSAEDIAAMLDDGTHRDLSGDNALPGLLAERAGLKATASVTERRLKEIDYEIKNRIGPASTAYVPGWSITFRRQLRKEHVVPAADVRVLRIKEITEEVE